MRAELAENRDTRTLAMQNLQIFKIELIKINLIGRNVSFFVNRKQVVNFSTLTYSTLLGTTKGFLHT